MKIAIVGPLSGCNALFSFLTRYADSICAEAEITSVDQLTDLPQDLWKLAFIYASEDSFDAYLDFLSANPDCEVVLWAEDDHLARSALRNHPCDFLVLPTDDEQFLRAMKKCQSWADSLRIISFSGVNSGRKIRCIEVQYVESSGHSCTIHCRDEAFTVNRGLSVVQRQLGAGFLRCHRGFVINLRCVAQVTERSVLLQDGTEVPLSPAQTEVISAEVRAYMREFAPLVQGGAAL